MLLELLFGAAAKIAFNIPDQAELDQYRYISVVRKDPHCIYSHDNKKLCREYIDPPIGGYKYEGADDAPYYWDNRGTDAGRSRHRIDHHKVTTKDQLIFEDKPIDYRLRAGERLEFTTCLVDSLDNNKALECVEWYLNHKKEYIPTAHYVPQDNSVIDNARF